MLISKNALFGSKWIALASNRGQFLSAIRASQSLDNSSRNDKVFKELGLYSLKKKIEDAVTRAEMVTSSALDQEEEKRIGQEAVIRGYSLWDDFTKSDESLSALGDAIKVVNELKDIRYKAEEAKLITELAEMDVINHQLLKQAYEASLDVSKFVDRYEMSKLLSGPYEKEGVCLIIKAGQDNIISEIWTKKLLEMYVSWAEKHGFEARVIEMFPSKGTGTAHVTIEIESEYVYGYLAGERGLHKMITSPDGPADCKTCSATVDVIPLFLKGDIELNIDEKDLEISSLASNCDELSGYKMEAGVVIHHIPSGIISQSSGERNYFGNKIKAINRLKAKLLVHTKEQGVSEPNKVKWHATLNELKKETRRYYIHPQKIVHDLKSGIQLSDLKSVLDGNIEEFIKAHINHRHRGRTTTTESCR